MGAISLEDVCVSYSERRTYWKWFLEICDEPAGNVGQGQFVGVHLLADSARKGQNLQQKSEHMFFS